VSKFTSIDERLHRYLVDHGARQDDVLRRVEEETAAMGEIANMQIAPDQGAFMTLLARAIGATEALEVGTFTGYSAICLARGLAPGGRLLCCELSEEYAATAARNIEDAGVAERVEIRVGPAAETLAALPDRELFDLTFIDADKPAYPVYYEESLRRTRAGGLILLDNVLAGGSIASPDGEIAEGWRESVVALRELNDRLVEDERVDLAMVGIADGLTIARKR
jgi:caffeoyl-CoA O-methyltransferase